MSNQHGVIHLLAMLLIVVVLGAIGFLIWKGVIKLPGISNLPLVQQKETNVAIKSQYKNPFKKETQYVNPFDEYKSPFLSFERK